MQADRLSVSPKCSARPKAGAIAGQNPDDFQPCKGTKGARGRCVEKSGLGSYAETFEQGSCAGDEACVPDEVVAKGSAIELESCTGVLESEGRCFWPLAKDIIENYSLLAAATGTQCPKDMVCAPCVHPLTKEETGVCSMGAKGGAAKGGASACSPSDSSSHRLGPDRMIDTAAPIRPCGRTRLCVATGTSSRASFSA